MIDLVMTFEQGKSQQQKIDLETKNQVCPVCGSLVVSEKCKIVCRSEKCVYRIIYNCSEF